MAQMVRRIRTNGYRGPGTKYAYLPAGEYEVGGALVSRGLALEMLAIGLAWVTETASEQPEPQAAAPAPEGEVTEPRGKAPRRANKIVDVREAD